MTNVQFNKLLKKLSHANGFYKDLLHKAEEEFNNRYNTYPSNIDFDPWIDAFHIAVGFLTAEEIEKNMKEWHCQAFKE